MAAPRRAPGGGGTSPFGFLASLYRDEFRWSLMKSTAIFMFGIYIAREFKGVDLASPPQPALA
eukprot:TCALIF_02150-PA protein Name:"Protein of unknown function" AED:0.10 eAED:0.10 QI:0/-1/0/1/-1/1/1/0/62